jgi:hypothetical protein
LVSAFAAVAAMAETNAPATFAEAKKAIADRASALGNKLLVARIADFEALRATTPYSTNAALKADINGRILSWCLEEFHWPSFHKADRPKRNAKAEELCRMVLGSDDYTPQGKERYARVLANILAGKKDFDGAEKVAREHIARVEALEKRDEKALVYAWMTLADVFRWQDRADDMVAAIEKARAIRKLDATREGVDKALALGGLNDKIDAWWRDLANPFEEASYYIYKNPARCRKLAYDYVTNPTNPFPRRVDILTGYFLADNGEDAHKARALLGREGLVGHDWRFPQSIKSAFQHGDYRLTVDLFEELSHTNTLKSLSTPVYNRVHIIALGVLGRKDDAVALAKAHEADGANKPLDTLRYQIYAAILSGKDALPIIAKSPCDRKEKMAATLSAARQCQLWEMTEAAEKYAEAYDKYFGPPPKRVAKVVWSDTPVSGVTDWRAILPKLEVHKCDLKFTASLDFLETDVATGREKVVIEEGAKPTRMTMTTVADRYALHIFLRVEDPEARLVEGGFKRGVNTEMYFAPGVGQPYVCFGSNPREGLSFIFNTSYTSSDHKRIDRKAVGGQCFRSETAFTDDDYVLHLSFPWDDYYQKLPSPKADWRFECMSWCPDGGYTWGGSIGIHNASRWGTLAIDLTPKQLSEIRRGILVRTVKGGWRNCHYPNDASLDYFDKWADPELGDPEFYETCLKPLDEELAGYAARVKPDMTDDEVNEIYEKGLVRMKGLKYEIDRLRREFLGRKLTD